MRSTISNLTHLPKLIIAGVLLTLFSACNHACKTIDKHAGYTEIDKIIEAAILQDTIIYSIRDSLAKVYVVNKEHHVRYHGTIVWLSHLTEDHHFDIADSTYLYAQNKVITKPLLSAALKKKLHKGEKAIPTKANNDSDEPPGYCVMSIPITSKDGNTTFVTAAHYCGHCMYTDDYFLKKVNGNWHLVAKKYYKETDGG